jgi:hypothetical protein
MNAQTQPSPLDISPEISPEISPDVLVDGAAVQRLAAQHGLALDEERAAALAPFVQALFASDARLAALDLATLPAAGLPWAGAAAGNPLPAEAQHAG